MSKRDFGKIKSLLHFDYPYYGETCDGLRDEARDIYYARIGDTKLAGTEAPYEVFHAPKFGWRCAHFPNKNSGIICGNYDGAFDIDLTGDYELEVFIKYLPSDGDTFIFKTPSSIDYNFGGLRFYDDHTFKYVNYSVTWEEAKKLCELMGGHLATATGVTKQSIIRGEADEKSIWLGGTNKNNEGVWEWITGEEWYFTDWASNQPDNAGNAEHYLQLYSGSEGQWNDAPATTKLPFVCEWDYLVPYSHDYSLYVDPETYEMTFTMNTTAGSVSGYSSSALTPNEWQHILLRISGGTVKIFLNGEEVISKALPNGELDHYPFLILGGYVGYMDEFVFRYSAGAGAPIVPTEPYKGTLNVNNIGGFGTGEDRDVRIIGYSVINAYGAITNADTPKTIEINSWSTPNVVHDGKFIYGGHTFQLFKNYLTWPEAQAYCEELGGHLATSTSAEKNAFLVSTTQGNTIWLGLSDTDEATQGTWKWVTGETLDYTNWGSGEPNGGYGSEPYAEMNNSGLWNDIGTSTTHYFICEWDYEQDKAFTPQPSVGSEVMIHITHSVSNDNGDYPYTGLYAFARIASINGTNIILDKSITIENGYDFTLSNELLEDYYVQVITVPNFSSLTINSGVTINPITWTAETGGGIVAFRCTGDCTVNGSIITSGYGVTRTDLTPMDNAKLIDRFLCASGGGVFIACGGTGFCYMAVGELISDE